MVVSRIVVGVDGSDNAVRAVEWAAGLATATGAEVVAVHALGLIEHLDGDEIVPSEPHRDEIRQRFETHWCAPLDAAGVSCRKLLRDGTAQMAILGAADELGADLIVVGSRGLGGFPELLLGSTSTQVAQQSRCPVTIVPPAERA